MLASFRDFRCSGYGGHDYRGRQGLLAAEGKAARRFEPMRNVGYKWVVALGKMPQHYNYIKYLFQAPVASVTGDTGKRNWIAFGVAGPIGQNEFAS